MSKTYPILLSTLLLATSLNAQEEGDHSRLITHETKVITTDTTHFSPLSPFTGEIVGSKVRMRIQPTLDGYVVRETQNGEMFVVVSETNDYYAVIPPKQSKGYVFRTFILDGEVEGERVNVRLYPDMDAPVVGQLNRGDHVISTVSDANTKWLEIDLPESSRFYIAKEYIENKGSAELLAIIEKKRTEAVHRLSAAALFAQAEIQKPFEQIDLDHITTKFEQISQEYHDLPLIVEQAQETTTLMQEIYVQKKIAFLEGKANCRPISSELDSEHLAKLAKLADNTSSAHTQYVSDIAASASRTMGLASTLGGAEITDKMLIWQPLEESIYHLWAAANGERSLDEFYSEEEQAAMILTGIVEPYSRPVKNRPGDFLLKNNNMPVAFLYSTRVNLEKLVGQKITILAAPRPNHNFAFPAYFVISSIE